MSTKDRTEECVTPSSPETTTATSASAKTREWCASPRTSTSNGRAVTCWRSAPKTVPAIRTAPSATTPPTSPSPSPISTTIRRRSSTLRTWLSLWRTSYRLRPATCWRYARTTQTRRRSTDRSGISWRKVTRICLGSTRPPERFHCYARWTERLSRSTSWRWSPWIPVSYFLFFFCFSFRARCMGMCFMVDVFISRWQLSWRHLAWNQDGTREIQYVAILLQWDRISSA